MLFTNNLEEIVFRRHQLFDTDELLILSGYIGPTPVSRLDSLPFETTVIYGMYGSDSIGERLHTSLISLHESIDNVKIYYSNSPVHSKCYIWKKSGNIVHALVGSANFSTNGLTTPFREILAETTFDTFSPLDDYVNTILENSIFCVDGIVGRSSLQTLPSPTPTTDYCTMSLLDPKTGETQNASGINWGQNPNNHTNLNDASIPIRAKHIRAYNELFPSKQIFPSNSTGGRTQRHNDNIEIIWDDGETMQGLLEGNYPILGIKYPKQISSFPSKSILGRYIRRRINVPDGARVTKNDLDNYGRTDIDVSLLGEGIYYFDFSI